MITREEAEALAGAAAEHAEVLARTVVALYDERDALAGHRSILHEAATQGRAASESTAKALVAARAEVAALALELRRLRAAEAPGTDDDAFAGTGWTWSAGTSSWEWSDRAVFDFGEGTWGWSLDSDDVEADDYEYRNGDFTFALDAMRAAVPGSV